MSALVTFTYTEYDDNTGEREVTLTRFKDDIDLNDLMYFFADAARTAGYTYVEQVGCCTGDDKETWSEF